MLVVTGVSNCLVLLVLALLTMNFTCALSSPHAFQILKIRDSGLKRDTTIYNQYDNIYYWWSNVWDLKNYTYLKGFTTPFHSSTRTSFPWKTSASVYRRDDVDGFFWELLWDALTKEIRMSLQVVLRLIPDIHLEGRSLCSQNGISTTCPGIESRDRVFP